MLHIIEKFLPIFLLYVFVLNRMNLNLHNFTINQQVRYVISPVFLRSDFAAPSIFNLPRSLKMTAK